DKELYSRRAEHGAAQSRQNRQGRDAVLAGTEAARVFDLLKKDAELVYQHYMEMLNEGDTGEPLDPDRSGLARELARMNLSLNFYTQWYWKTNLHNLMHFLSLRADAHAQYEIRAYAEVMIDTLRRWCPLCHDAFMEYRMGGAHLSKTGLAAVRRMIAGEKLDQKSSGLNPREWRELMAALGLGWGSHARPAAAGARAGARSRRRRGHERGGVRARPPAQDRLSPARRRRPDQGAVFRRHRPEGPHGGLDPQLADPDQRTLAGDPAGAAGHRAGAARAGLRQGADVARNGAVAHARPQPDHPGWRSRVLQPVRLPPRPRAEHPAPRLGRGAALPRARAGRGRHDRRARHDRQVATAQGGEAEEAELILPDRGPPGPHLP